MTERRPAMSPAGPRDVTAAIAAGRRSHKEPHSPSPETPWENSGLGRSRCHRNPHSPSLEPLWERRPRRDAAVAGRDGVLPAGPRDMTAAIAAGRRSYKNLRSPSPETQWENSGHGRSRSHKYPHSPSLEPLWERRPRRDAAVTGRDGVSPAGPRDVTAAIAAGRRSHKMPHSPSPETPWWHSGHGRSRCHKNPHSPSLEPLWERRPRRDAAAAGRDDSAGRGAR